MMPSKGRSGRARAGLWTATLAVGLLSLGALAACETSLGADGQGRFSVLLTDAPFPFELVSEANVTISRVDVVGEAGVQALAEGEQTFNLLELQDGVTAALGSTEMPEGRVSQIRLIVTDASIVLTDGTEFDLFVPSGAQTGIKIVLGAAVEAGAETIATLDFDVEDSFIVQGNPDTPAGILGFIFKPVIRVAAVSNAEPAGVAEDGQEEEEEEQEEQEEENGGGEENGDGS